MRLIMTRHGETEENLECILQGHLPGHLTEKGREQAICLAKRLRDERIDVIYSSDLARAADTAREIARFHRGAPLMLVKELRERNLGELQGKRYDEAGWDGEEMKERFFMKIEGQHDGVETWEEMRQRSEDFIHGLIKKHKDDSVLVVAHAGINNAIVYTITGKMTEELTGNAILGNTSITVFEIEEDRSHKIHLLDCAKHLD